MILLCDRSCPYAHRIRALLAIVEHPYEVRESMVGDKPEGLAGYSPSGRIPLLVDDDLVLAESRVILEHLAERFELTDAYPAGLSDRSRHRHAMAVFDELVAPGVFDPAGVSVGDPRFEEGLHTLEDATATVDPGSNLLTLHVAPFWMRFRWWHPNGTVVRAVQARPPLRRWLDASAQLSPLLRTAPSPDVQAEDLARARQAGLLPPEMRIPT